MILWDFQGKFFLYYNFYTPRLTKHTTKRRRLFWKQLAQPGGCYLHGARLCRQGKIEHHQARRG